MWDIVKSIDSSVDSSEHLTKGNLPLKPDLVTFLDHCCRQRQYFFEIRKCGENDCSICTPVCLPEDVFHDLKPLPDPVPCIDGHYLSFTDSYGK